jgi:hypothetical protein
MIVKLKKFHLARAAAPRSGATAIPCNDNAPVRVVALSRRAQRPALLCRWQQTPAGALECGWQITSPDVSAADEPGMRRRSGWRVLAGRRRHAAKV